MQEEADPREVEFQAQMAELRAHFFEGLPERRAALTSAWSACADGGEEDPWERLRDVAHRLSGSAGSYGLEALGDLARELDRLLSGHPPCRERALVGAFVAALALALDAAIDS